MQVSDNAQPAHHHAPHQSTKKWRFTPSAFALIVGLTGVLGYVAGMRNDQIVAAVGPVLGFKVETGTLDLSSVQETFRQLKTNFEGDLDESALIEGASRGLVDAAGDEHTIFMSSKEAEEFNNDLQGNIGGGIGAEIGLRSDKPTVIRTLKNSPAERAGVMPDDIIAGVNDESAAGWTVSEAVDHIRGEEGSTVKLTVLRDGQPKEFTITREAISSPSVESKVEGALGVLTISRFDERTTPDARQAAQAFKEQGVTHVILDLRGNSGGYLQSAQDVAGLWLRDKVVVSERAGGKVTDELKSGSNPVLEGMKTVVLVNGTSASASEIVAGALQDHGAATLIGEKTYGKGSVQKLVDLRAGSLLKVTVAKWYTPKGKNIDKEGIAPNKTVELKREDVNAGRDPQLDAAKAELGL